MVWVGEVIGFGWVFMFLGWVRVWGSWCFFFREFEFLGIVLGGRKFWELVLCGVVVS